MSGYRRILFFLGMVVWSSLAVSEDASTWYRQGQATLAAQKQVVPNTGKARNVILFVGDGMGVATVTAARILEGQRRGVSGEGNQLAFEKLPYLALSKTYSANQQTPDSAPTMTAMVTGVKTNDGMLSVDQSISSGEKDRHKVDAARLTTILQLAEQQGLSTGVVTTTRVTHATPAATYAHTAMRDWESDNNVPPDADVPDIASQLIDYYGKGGIGNGLEVVLGGGRSRFMPNTADDPEDSGKHGDRRDGRNLIDEFLAKFGGTYVWSKAQFDAVEPSRTERLLGLFERSHMKYEYDRPSDTAGEPSLAEMTGKAIDILKRNRKGFFLMVEGGRIDHAHHAGNAYRALTETIALSDAVRVALQKISLKDTLVIVTADHSHTMTIAGYPERGNPMLGKVTVDGKVQLAADGHSYTTLSYANGSGYAQHVSPDTSARRSPQAGRVEDLLEVDTEDADFHQEATVPLESETHGGEDVEIFAGGPKAYLFRGIQEQNYIFHVMKDAFGF